APANAAGDRIGAVADAAPHRGTRAGVDRAGDRRAALTAAAAVAAPAAVAAGAAVATGSAGAVLAAARAAAAPVVSLATAGAVAAAATVAGIGTASGHGLIAEERGCREVQVGGVVYRAACRGGSLAAVPSIAAQSGLGRAGTGRGVAAAAAGGRSPEA